LQNPLDILPEELLLLVDEEELDNKILMIVSSSELPDDVEVELVELEELEELLTPPPKILGST
jgi:hypothetical protein